MNKEKILQLVATALGDARHATVIVLTTIDEPPTAEAAAMPQPRPLPVCDRFEPQHTSRQRNAEARKHSRFNFEKNLLMLALRNATPGDQLTDYGQWTGTAALAQRIVDILHITADTAKNHIARGVAMGVLERKRDGNRYYVRIRQDEPQRGNVIDLRNEAEKTEAETAEALLP